MVRVISSAILVSAIVIAYALATEARPAFEIDEFSDDRNGHADLYITCDNGKKVKVRFKREALNKISIERLYDQLEKECQNAQSSTYRSSNGGFSNIGDGTLSSLP